jgi:hypothetical protein
MVGGVCSLRAVVTHWLACGSAEKVRVTAFRHGPAKHGSYVCVEAVRSDGPVAMFFFRHLDGSWRIYPPNRERLAFRVA